MAEVAAVSGLFGVARRAGGRLGTANGWQVVLGFDSVEAELAAARARVALVDGSPVGKLLIQGRGINDVLEAQFGAVPAAPTELARTDGGWLARLNRFEYTATLPLDQVDGIVTALRAAFAGRHAHVTDMTHGLDVTILIGPKSPETLSKVCPLDFSPREFPDLRAQRSTVAKVSALIAHVDREGLLCYEMHVDRSFSEHLWECLHDAGAEFGASPIGLETLARLPGFDDLALP